MGQWDGAVPILRLSEAECQDFAPGEGQEGLLRGRREASQRASSMMDDGPHGVEHQKAQPLWPGLRQISG